MPRRLVQHPCLILAACTNGCHSLVKPLVTLRNDIHHVKQMTIVYLRGAWIVGGNLSEGMRILFLFWGLSIGTVVTPGARSWTAGVQLLRTERNSATWFNERQQL